MGKPDRLASDGIRFFASDVPTCTLLGGEPEKSSAFRMNETGENHV